MNKFILFTFVVLFLLSLTETYAGEKHNSDEWQIKAYSARLLHLLVILQQL